VVTVPFSTIATGFADLAALRGSMRDWLAQAQVHGDAVEDLLLAVTELATNAIEASPEGSAAVDAETDRARVEVVISNTGPPFEPPVTRSRELLRTRGRGLDLVAAFVDTVNFDRCDDVTAVTITKTL
jgi:anti-sigma regulatory factor (Ser/Thr protein kinase)